jgi:hypothetical protein
VTTAVYLWCYRYVPDWLREATWLAFLLAVLFLVIWLLVLVTGPGDPAVSSNWGP